MDERYLERREVLEQYFKPENKVDGSQKIVISPCGKYQIDINQYRTVPNQWVISRGIVIEIDSGKVIADIRRNHIHFWYAWVEHPNGNEYLLCGEDYQGYSILNLTSGKYQTYFPEEAYKGWGFCWIEAYPSPDGLLLAGDGCYWAHPTDLVIYDFRNPEKLPYPELGRINGTSDCDGWVDNDTFVLNREIKFRKSDGMLYDSLSDEEQDVLDKNLSLLGTRIETVHHKRPTLK
jgi:hypothetical protein